MSVIELDISTSAEDLFSRIGGEGGAFWLSSQATDGATFMGFAPQAQLALHADGSLLRAEGGVWREVAGDPLRAAEELVASAPPLPTLPRAARTAGFFAYDLARLLEERIRPRHDPSSGLPLYHLARYDALIEVPLAIGPSRAVRVHATDDATAARCADIVRTRARRFPRTTDVSRPDCSPRVLEVPRADVHLGMVERALGYIVAGDVYQVNLAQRFRVRSDEPAAQAYLRLRAAQNVPYGVYLDCDGFAVLCSSPERFVRVVEDTIETGPIKGTRRRDADPARDDALRAELLRDPKERAEHVMIVDLERNDLGRLCVPGSVRVPSLLRVESFETVHHLVSTVRGRLRHDVGLPSLLRATFPGGSITGAPKIRAAQIIAELEQQPREIYTGCVAWFRGVRDFDSAIAIRTAVAHEGVYTYYAGGGIVADSDPLREYEECLLKAEPFLRALGVAAREGSALHPRRPAADLAADVASAEIHT